MFWIGRANSAISRVPTREASPEFEWRRLLQKCYWESLKDTEIRVHSLAKSMAWCTRNVTPMRKQLSHVSSALSHRYGVMVNIVWRLQSFTCTCVDLSPVGALWHSSEISFTAKAQELNHVDVFDWHLEFQSHLSGASELAPQLRVSLDWRPHQRQYARGGGL